MHYYNDIDKNVAAWVRELISRKLVPEGEVDERSILDIHPSDLKGFTQCHFFCGILGWVRALQLAGIPTARRVWSMSCPCQPFSTAGEQKGQADERHLWPVAFELIRQCRPEFVVGEQVANAIGHGWLDGISADLESEDYACGAAVLGAHSVGAPHIRQRLYWMAYSNRLGSGSGRGNLGEVRNVSEAECEPEHGAFVSGGSGSADGGMAHSAGVRRHQQWGAEAAAIQGERPQRSGEPAPEGRLRQLPRRPERLGTSTDSGMGDTRCQRDELGRGAGDVGCTAGEEQGEARERQRCGNADSGAGFDDAAFWGLEHIGRGRQEMPYLQPQHGAHSVGAPHIRQRLYWMAYSNRQRSQGRERPELCKRAEQLSVGPRGAFDFWSDHRLVPCRDGKARRIESGVEPLVDGLPRGVVSVGDCGVQEAQATAEARVMRLKGYGNAIVPQAAAQFLLAAEAARYDRA